jgi:cytosine/adenosine deaminase-related metal-dependent hydrolase
MIDFDESAAINCGITALLDHFHAAHSPEFVQRALDATIESGIRSMFCVARQSLPTSADPPQWSNDEKDLEWQLDLLRTLAEKDEGRLTPDGRVTLGLAYDPTGISLDTDKRVVEFARKLNISPITAHHVGIPHAPGYGHRIAYWYKNGLLKGDVIFSHCSDLRQPDCDENEWNYLKETGASISATPEGEVSTHRS